MPRLAAGPPAEQVERAVEAAVQVGERERRQPSRGELDGQRHPVEAADDVGDQFEVRGRGRRAGAHSAGPVEEHRHGGNLRRLLPGARQRERGQPEGVFGGQAERLAARRQHAQPRAGRQQRADDVARGVEQVLAVVDHQQAGPVAEQRRAGGQDVARDDVQVQRRGERVRDRGGVGDRGEQHDGRGVGPRRDLQRDPGLTDPARPDDRHQPVRGEQPVQGRYLLLAADEPRRRPGPCGRGGCSRSGDVALDLAERR